MPKPTTHPEVIALWRTKADFARAIGIKPSAARMIAKGGFIPSRHWHAVAAAAERDGFGPLTYADLSAMWAATVPY